MENIIDRLEWLMAHFGLNNNSLTVKAGLSVGLIGTARKTRKGLHSDTIEKILYAFPEVNAWWFITGKGERLIDGNLNGNPNGNLITKTNLLEEPKHTYLPKVVMVDQDDRELIPIVPHKAAAGYLTGYADPEYIEKLPAIRLPGFSGRTYRGFEARGQSMLPNIYPGSLNVGSFVESLDDIRNRRLYIVVTRYDGIVIKRVVNHVKDTGKLILISDNKNKSEYPTFSVDAEEVLEIWYWRGVFNTQAPEPYDMYNQFNDLQAKVTILQEQIEQLKSGRLNN